VNADSDAKLTDGGNPFHTLTIRSAKKIWRILLTLRDLNSLYAFAVLHVDAS